MRAVQPNEVVLKRFLDENECGVITMCQGQLIGHAIVAAAWQVAFCDIQEFSMTY